ncbi:MAG: type I glutamate--ammonia ligase [Eubacteriales bacterium]|nr:type I glutamate--ammonia ligase [Eubacteriales bacterium]
MMKKSFDQASILKELETAKVRFVRMQFTDLFGKLKNLVIPVRSLESALKRGVLFDGSSIEGFVRIEESDMYLKADLSSFVILPEGVHQGASARFICDVVNASGEPFLGDPRQVLRKNLKRAADLGFEVFIGPEMEFYLMELDSHGLASTVSYDRGSYFDLGPADLGERARQNMVIALEDIGFNVEAAHHENAASQHEIDFTYTDALKAADQVMTFKYVVKASAAAMGLHASFMPKPVYGQAGNGMHCNISLAQNGKNVFYDPNADLHLSVLAKQFIAGLLHHAKAITAVTNPTVNSYKRLVPDFEAPCYIAWSAQNRSPLIRIPSARGENVRIELRSPDPSCNPYLAFAVILAAGLDGIEHGYNPANAVNENIFAMSEAKRRMLNIEALPMSIHEALQALEEDQVICDSLGEHLLPQFLRAKRLEWRDYNTKISQWELDRYLDY